MALISHVVVILLVLVISLTEEENISSNFERNRRKEDGILVARSIAMSDPDDRREGGASSARGILVYGETLSNVSFNYQTESPGSKEERRSNKSRSLNGIQQPNSTCSRNQTIQGLGTNRRDEKVIAESDLESRGWSNTTERRGRHLLSDVFISKEESNSFLTRSRRVRRRGKVEITENRGPLPLKDLNSDKFRNFRYRFPERTEWFPSYVNVWDMCVFKQGRKFEGLIGKNRWRKYCKWEEVYEIHKGKMRLGFTYEFASATMAFINCLRNDDPEVKKTDCPKPCTSNPCRYPHMASCSETGSGITKGWTCTCNPGYTFNTRTKRCDDMKVCGTSRETCIRTKTIECKDKAGLAHECVCHRRWMGARCEKPYDACVDYDNPCGQHGRCEAHSGQRTWTCHCSEGWGDDPNQEGRDCNRKDKVCDNIVCLNGGECQESQSGQVGTCICTDEWTGDRCADPMPTWTMWQPWAKCSVTCGYGGTRVRRRDCDHREALYCGPGTDEEHSECTGPICVVDGEWSAWIKITDCSYNCGGGHYIKARNCIYETDDPEAFGEPCSGGFIVYADCNIMSCPQTEERWLRIDINSLARTVVSQTDSAAGDWGAWNSWSECSSTCDVGFRSRNRICLSSIGACEGSAEEVEDCTEEFCNADAGLLPWGTWSYWTRCAAGKDFCFRYRECPYTITDEEFLEACPGKSSQSVPCEEDRTCGKLDSPPPPPPRGPHAPVAAAAGAQHAQRMQGGAMQYPVYNQGPAQAQRGLAEGESSAIGVGSVALVGGIAFAGYKFYQKMKIKKEKAKQKKDEPV